MNRKISKTGFALIFLLIGIFAITNASACSCIAFENEEQKLDAFDLIFMGTVIEEQTLESYPVEYKTTFEIEAYWKTNAELPRSYKLTINSIESDGANCGIRFEQGKSYIVYASQIESGEYIVNSCSTSRLVEEGGDLSGLGKPTPALIEIPTIQEEPKNIFRRFWSWLTSIF